MKLDLGKIFFLILFLTLSVMAATAGTIKGTITDRQTKEPLTGATVQVSGTAQGAVADLDGNYTLELKNGTYTLTVRYIGYKDMTINAVEIKGETVLNFDMEPDTQTLGEVQVTAKKNLEGERALQMERQKATLAIENLGSKEMSLKGIGNVEEGVKKITGISIALAEVMDSVQLMVLQGVYVHDVVAAGQLVSFGISTFAALVGVDGVAGVEESVAYAVAPAQGVAQVAEGGELQFLRKAVVGEVVLHGAGGLECLVEGIFHVLVAVAGAEGGEQAECLVAYNEVLAEAEVPAQFGQRTLLAGAEGGIEDIAGLHVFVKLHQGHAEGGCVHSGCLQERAAAVHLIAVFA